MSWKVTREVWERSQHKGGELLVLLALAEFADEAGLSFPSIATIAKRCRMTSRSVNRAIARLRLAGELSVRPNEGPKGVNLYRVTLEGVTSASAPLTTTPPLTHTSPPLTQKVLPPDAGVPQPLTPTSGEPSLNRQEPPSIGGDGSAKAKQAGEGRFVDFWSNWPRNDRKQDRRKCLEFWKRHALDSMADLILGDIRAKVGTQKWRDGFIEAPLVYLHNRRWEDSLEIPGGTAGMRRPSSLEGQAQIKARGAELGMEWSEDGWIRTGEGPPEFLPFPSYAKRVRELDRVTRGCPASGAPGGVSPT